MGRRGNQGQRRGGEKARVSNGKHGRNGKKGWVTERERVTAVRQEEARRGERADEDTAALPKVGKKKGTGERRM